jgi:ribosome modulation factor
MPAAGQEHGGWDTPPREFNEIERRGFQDGITGARHDMDNHRAPDVNNRDEYRNPQVPGNLREAYRNAFRRGYEAALSHPMPAAHTPILQAIVRAWDAPPEGYQEFQRRGFHDGIEAAHRDIDNNRRPDPENRDEFRHPSVPYEMVGQYRDGFRKGYEVAMEHLTHAAPPPPPVRAWDAPPDEFQEFQRRGFHDGIEGAHRDFDNNRRPDPENRDEFRHPNVPYEMVGQYREGFRKGYETAMAHLMGDHRR